ncbi:GerAB/ArcD/ProY family transporter [Brassicibacter mesophilus]|uniref:GerAB/ArcD/ProY family transporter n=1 Tax=Brassicibacter mesophilus TaxID=745119 RepID=UPI003D246FCF
MMNETLNNRQIAFIIYGTIVGYGILALPKQIAENAGTGGWVPLLLATIASIIITYIIAYLGCVYENKTLYEYSQILVGRYITYIFLALYIVYFFLFFTMIARMSGEVIKLTILLKTPVWAISLLYLIVVYYAIIKGIKVVARICELYGFIIIFGAFIIHFLMFTQGEMINLKPFFVIQDVQEYIKTSFKLVIPFLGMEAITFLPLRKENKKGIFKYTALMIAFIGLSYIIIFEANISVVGVDDIVHYKDAIISTVRRIDIKYLETFRRLDGILLLVWNIAVFTTMMMFAYGTTFYISKCFKNISYRLVAIIVITMSFIVSQAPKTVIQVEKIIDFTGYLAVIAAVIIPLILLIITKVKKYDKKV